MKFKIGLFRFFSFFSSQLSSCVQVPTPDVRAPFERRSSLRLYEARCQRLKRLQSSTSSVSPDDEQPSPTQCSVMEETVRRHFFTDDNRQQQEQAKQADEEEEEEEDDYSDSDTFINIRNRRTQRKSSTGYKF